MRLRILPIFLILVIGGMGIFGFLGFSLIEQGDFHVCPVSLISGGDCPPLGSAFVLTIHHISGLQQLSRFIINIDSASLVLSLALMTFVLLAFFNPTRMALAEHYALYFRSHKIDEFSFGSNWQLFRWLSLRNKRDSHASSWVHDSS